MIRPQSDPVANLADALLQLGLAEIAPENLAHFAPGAFGEFLHRRTPPGQVNLLLIDQFEEIFTQSVPAQRESLIRILVDFPPFDAGHTHALITLRSDFLKDMFRAQRTSRKSFRSSSAPTTPGLVVCPMPGWD